MSEKDPWETVGGWRWHLSYWLQIAQQAAWTAVGLLVMWKLLHLYEWIHWVDK